MSVKIKKTFKILLGIIMFPVLISCFDYTIKLIMQMGRIVGTIIRIIMDL